ncbi:MAG TPA: MFS transporter [Solirubrobacteraceae bacterium]|jgi:EmrB/QacA subfamily drug resistance transporter|nr:MFS transporter [Solirubrobacteraceae bacterium]
MTSSNPHHARRWAILGILGLAQLMVVLDSTIVNIALPSAQHALHFTNDNRQWIITAYALAFGSLLLLGGKISDLFGRKWTFIGGLAGFAIASAVGGAAQSFGMLAAARTAQGAFGALLAPAALSLLTTTFIDGAERNKAFGVYSAIAGSGASIGLLLGGILTQTLTWRYCMYVNLVFATIAVIGALRLLHNVRPERRERIDVPGVLTVSGGLFGLVYGFSHAETASWGSPLTIGSLVTGAALLAVFALLQSRGDHPLLPLRVLADRNRGGSFMAILISGAAMFGVFLFLTYYLQQTRGYSPITTGLAFLPMTGVVMVTAVLSTTRLRDRFGPRNLVVLGMLLGAAGMGLLTQLSLTSAYATAILPALIVMGVGLGLVFSSGMFGATLGVRPSDAGVASATVTASQQVGGSLGTALLSTIAASAGASYLTGHLTGSHPTAALIAHASVHGYVTAFAFAAAIFLVGAIVSAVLFERGVPQVAVTSEAVMAH